MGSKGSQQTQTAQQQTYQPDPYARQATEAALGQAYNVAQTPFQTPVAPVAGFSPQQQQAFQATEAAQGYAQPYIQQAANYFSPQGTQSFLNPYTANVTANLQDIFGQQMSQATGQAVQQAGGQGADRVAVAQSQLAKQQALAAGQTYAGLYGNAAQLAQGAGFGTANLGTAGQNAALQGAGALLGTGGLQQQLEQARLNAPYQNILQQIAWPYQNSQFLSGAVGALAPGLGGTTAGTGSNIYPGASNLGTIAGLGLAGAGVYGIGNKQGWFSGTPGGGGGGGAPDYTSAGDGSARGGRINPYARGGDADDDTGFSMPTAAAQNDPIRYAEMQQLEAAGNPGAVQTGQQSQLPSGVSGQPVDVTPKSLVPQTQLVPIKPTIPQLNLSQPQGGGGSGGGKGSGMSDVASIVGSVAKIAPLLMMARGGSANPYEHLDHIKSGMHRVFGRGGRTFDDGGSVDDGFGPTDPNDPNYAAGISQLKKALTPYAPQEGLGEGLETRASQIRDAMSRSPDDANSSPPPARASASEINWPIARQPTLPAQASAFAPTDETTPPVTDVSAASRVNPNPYAPAAGTDDTALAAARHKPGIIDSPWMALLTAGLGTMAAAGQRDARGLPTPPLAAIGQGGLQGIQALQTQRQTAQKDTTIEQEARKLDQAVKFHTDTLAQQKAFHEDPYNRMTKAQEETARQNREKEERELRKPFTLQGPYGISAGSFQWDPDKKRYVPIDPHTGAPQTEAPAGPTSQTAPGFRDPRTGQRVEESAVKPVDVPVSTVSTAFGQDEDAALPLRSVLASGVAPEGVRPEVLEDPSLTPGQRNKIKAIGEGRAAFLPTARSPLNQMLMDKAYEYNPNLDQTTFSRRQKAENFFSVGTAGGGGQNVVALNRFAAHTGSLLALAEKLQASGFKDWNSIKFEAARHGLGSQELRDTLGRWDVNAKGVGDEAAKVFAGSNTALADRETWEKILDPSTPLSTMIAKLRQAVDMGEQALAANVASYNEGTRTNHQPREFLTPRSAAIFDAIKTGRPISEVVAAEQKQQQAPTAPAAPAANPYADAARRERLRRQQEQQQQPPPP